VPRAPSRELGPPGPPSADTFHDAFAGGWFAMFPTLGFVAELDGRPAHFHGELARLPWETVTRDERSLEARVETVNVPFAVVRRVVLDGGELRVETEIVNTSRTPASFLFGEHPCFARETFAGGRLELTARDGCVPSPAYMPERALLRPGAQIVWPHAPGRDGDVDLSCVPARPDGRADHACLELAGPRMRLTAPRFGRALELEHDLDATPYVQLAMNYGEGSDMLAIEPLSARVFGTEIAAGALRRLDAGATFRTATTLRWTD
jgi:galactose mutarotase-like enzyme